MEDEGKRRYGVRGRVGVGAERGFKPEFLPWRHTGSPKIRGVINLSMELANPTAPWPGNLAPPQVGAGLQGAKEH